MNIKIMLLLCAFTTQLHGMIRFYNNEHDRAPMHTLAARYGVTLPEHFFGQQTPFGLQSSIYVCYEGKALVGFLRYNEESSLFGDEPRKNDIIEVIIAPEYHHKRVEYTTKLINAYVQSIAGWVWVSVDENDKELCALYDKLGFWLKYNHDHKNTYSVIGGKRHGFGVSQY